MDDGACGWRYIPYIPPVDTQPLFNYQQLEARIHAFSAIGCNLIFRWFCALAWGYVTVVRLQIQHKFHRTEHKTLIIKNIVFDIIEVSLINWEHSFKQNALIVFFLYIFYSCVVLVAYFAIVFWYSKCSFNSVFHLVAVHK